MNFFDDNPGSRMLGILERGTARYGGAAMTYSLTSRERTNLIGAGLVVPPPQIRRQLFTTLPHDFNRVCDPRTVAAVEEIEEKGAIRLERVEIILKHGANKQQVYNMIYRNKERARKRAMQAA